MSDAIKWTVFFIEQYSGIKQISGASTYKLFKDTGAFEYILESAGALHTMGLPYLIEDVDGFIEQSVKEAV